MIPVRLTARRPVFRCLNAPPPVRPRGQIRRNGRLENQTVEDYFRQSSKRVRPGEQDHVSLHRAEEIRRAKAIKKRNWLAVGAALSMIAPIFLVRLWDVPLEPPATGKEEQTGPGIITVLKNDAPRTATDAFQGKKVVIAAGDKVIAAPPSSENPQASDVDSIELVETGTSYVPYFPRTIRLPTATAGPENIASDAEYTLLGLGIRKVSFLRVQVYVVGLYVQTSDLSVLQNQLINTVNPTASTLIAGEKEDLRTALLDPERSNAIWESILARRGSDAVNLALRVVPCRGTDFKHLQDGWMRGIASRTDDVARRQAELLRQQAAEAKQIALPKPVQDNEFADDSFGAAMKTFKAIFQGKGKAPKGSVILLAREKSGTLRALYQPLGPAGKEQGKMGDLTALGDVTDERVGRLVFLLYLGGKNVSSEDARKSVVEGCVGIVERPVGTVEGMVV